MQVQFQWQEVGDRGWVGRYEYIPSATGRGIQEFYQNSPQLLLPALDLALKSRISMVCVNWLLLQENSDAVGVGDDIGAPPKSMPGAVVPLIHP